MRCDIARGELFTGHKATYDALPSGFLRNIEAWRRNNSAFSFHYYTNAEQAAYAAMHCHQIPRLCQAYGLLNAGAARADVFRMLRMFVEGGWWFDADLSAVDLSRDCTQSCSSDGLILYRYDSENRPRYSLMGAPRPHHPILADTLSRMVHNTLAVKLRHTSSSSVKLQDTTYFVTGPHNLHRAACRAARNRRSYCGNHLVIKPNCPGCMAGQRAQFGGNAHTPPGVVYAEGPNEFRYSACPALAARGNIKDRLQMGQRMNVTHHSDMVA